MLTDQKILVTGPSGQIGLPLVQFLAPHNDVWGVARFNQPGSRELLESLGVTTRSIDLSSGNYSSLPDDFDYVIHLAAFKTEGLDYNHAITVNAEGTGLLLQHCQKAKAALVMSTHSVYKPVDDALHGSWPISPLSHAGIRVATASFTRTTSTINSNRYLTRQAFRPRLSTGPVTKHLRYMNGARTWVNSLAARQTYASLK